MSEILACMGVQDVAIQNIIKHSLKMMASFKGRFLGAIFDYVAYILTCFIRLTKFTFMPFS